MPVYLSEKTNGRSHKGRSRDVAAVMETLEPRTLLSMVGVSPLASVFEFNSTGHIAYTAATNDFHVTATPLSFMPSSPPPKQVTGTNAGPASLALDLAVDHAGNLVAGGTFQMTGSIDLNGDSNPEYTGILLTGTVTRFGWDNTDPASGGTDNFDFQLTVTGGAMQSLYNGMDLGITMISEHSTFAGFPGATAAMTDFDGGAKGNIGGVPQFNDIPPKILIVKSGPIFGQAGDVITYTYDVTNPIAQDPLANVGVTDDKAGTAAYVSGDTNNDGLLEVGETWHFSAQYTLPAIGCGTGVLINTATARGTWQAIQVTDQDTYQLNPYVMSKKLYLFYGGCKGSVLYSQADDTQFTVTASKDGQAVGTVGVSQSDGAQVWLANGSWTFQEADTPGYINVTGGPLSYVTGQGTNKGAFKNVITYDLAVDKTGPATANAGDKITYTYEVTNAGPAAVKPVLSDDKTGTPVYQSGDANHDGLIEAGETWLYTAQYTVPGSTSLYGGCGSWYGGYSYSGCGGTVQTCCCGGGGTTTSITNTATVDAAENPHSSSAIGGDTDPTNNTDTWTVQIGKTTVTLGSIAGKVYVDANNNGSVDYREQGLSSVQVILSGTDDQGNGVHRTVWTDCSGNYKFSNLRPGVYSVSHTQPKGFIEGKDGVGSLGGSLINGTLANIVLVSGGKGVNYNFAEILKQSGGCGGSGWNFYGWSCDDWKRWSWGCDTNWSSCGSYGSWYSNHRC
jgi:uncharacterized repeat protein (TIGR01451 family)